MFKRLLATIAIVSILASPALADDLGPATSNNIGSDPSTLNALQPATPSGLQSADSQNGGVKQSGSATSLQPAGTKSDFPSSLNLNGVADGNPHSLSDSSPTNHINQYILAMVGILMLICAFFTYRISKLLETKKAPTYPEAELSSDPITDLLEPSSHTNEEIPDAHTPAESTEEIPLPDEMPNLNDAAVIETPQDPKTQPKSKRSTNKKPTQSSRRKK